MVDLREAIGQRIPEAVDCGRTSIKPSDGKARLSEESNYRTVFLSYSDAG